MELYTKFEEFTKAHEMPQDQLLDMLSRSYGMSAADANAFLFRVREELLVNDVQPIRIADIIPLLGSAKCASRYELDNREPAAIVAAGRPPPYEQHNSGGVSSPGAARPIVQTL